VSAQVRIVWYDERDQELDRVTLEPGGEEKLGIPLEAQHCRVYLLPDPEEA
jgi:hypothetical protein